MEKRKRTSTNFCSEPQALVNVCLNCWYPTCKTGECQIYKIAATRLKFGVFPLVDVPVDRRCSIAIPKNQRCSNCIWMIDLEDRALCPFPKCIKEGEHD